MEKNKFLIAITGMCGSGKTTVSNILRKYGYYVFDSDSFSKKLLQVDENVKNKLNQLMRVKLIDIATNNFKNIGKIFDEDMQLEQEFEEWYQKYLGKMILEEKIITYNKNGFVFYDMPQLEQKGIIHNFDYIWIVESDYLKCFERIKIRNNYTDRKINYLLHCSKISESLYNNSQIIKNNGNISNLTNNIIAKLHQLISNN